MNAGLILNDRPGARLKFTTLGVLVDAYADPLRLGVDAVLNIPNRPKLINRLFDEDSQIDVMLADIDGSRAVDVLKDYLDAAGLGLTGLQRLIFGLTHLELLEVDLLRMGLDVRDWLNPAGDLSSRRVAVLIGDFFTRPETACGAKLFDVQPIDKAGLVAAQYVTSKMDKAAGKHFFLRSPDEVAEENKTISADRERRERIGKQQKIVLSHDSNSGASLDDARAESMRQFKELAGKA